MGFFDFLKGVVMAGVGFALSFTPLKPLSTFLIAQGLQKILPQPRLATRNASFRANHVSTDNPIHVVIGEAIVGGPIADYRTHALVSSFMDGVICLSHGSRDGSGIEAIEEIFVDGTLAVPAGAAALKGSGDFEDASPPVEPFYATKFAYGKYFGSDTQTVAQSLNTRHPTNWPSTSELLGVAYIGCLFANDPKVFPQLPTVTARVKGPHVYDPRDSTWKWSKNPALWIREAILNPIWGKGRDESELDEQSFIDAANHCDELVSTPAGNQARYEVSGVWDTSRKVEENLEWLEASCMGRVIQQAGLYRLVIRQAQSPTGFVFDESVIARGQEIAWKMPGLKDDGANSIIVSYIEPGAEQPDGTWTVDTVQRLQWPEVGGSNPYLTADYDFDAPETLELPFVRNRYRALQIASIVLKEKREADTFQFVAHEAAIENEVGDVAELDIDLIGALAPVPFWVMDLDILPGHVGIQGMRYNASAYTLPSLGTIADPPAPSVPKLGNVGDPTGLGVAAVRYCVGGTTTSIELIVSWTNPTTHPHDMMEIRYRQDTPSPGAWVTLQPYPDGAVSAQFAIPNVDDQETYRVGIRSRNPAGAVGNWVETTIDLSAVACTVDVPLVETPVDNGNSGSSITIDFSTGWYQKVTLTADATITLDGMVDGGVYALLLVQSGGPWSPTIAVAGGMPTLKWDAGAQPDDPDPESIWGFIVGFSNTRGREEFME